jgi:hypothetical protein
MLRPRGDITTVLDRADRDAQDSYFFPLNTDDSWFKRDSQTIFPLTTTVQEFTHKGTAEWGGKLTFEINSLQAGDLLNAVGLQIRLGHWYDPTTISKMLTGEYVVDLSSNPWTYADSLGSTLIEYAEFEVGDQTIERIDGTFARAFGALFPDANLQFGIATDAIGAGSLENLATNTGPFNPNRPYPVENGIYHVILPFFFLRTRLKEVFPLLSCAEGTVRVHVQLRPFAQCVRSTSGSRVSCDETPLGKTVTFNNGAVSVTTSSTVPAFQEFRMITYTALVGNLLRSIYMKQPFEQLIRLVQTFRFDEPLKYSVNKTNSGVDSIEIQLPLEFNHPVQEIFWVFRRKAVTINNEWANFRSYVETQVAPGRVFMPWLEYATLRVNGMILEQADGEWWRQQLASRHRGGYAAYVSGGIYGYSFARDCDLHQPTGSGNMSRASSVTLNLRVNVPVGLGGVAEGFAEGTDQGWEVVVYGIHFNWLRFQNGMCQRVFDS